MKNKTIEVLFLRHAHSEANEKEILAGRVEPVRLSEKGRKQSLQLREYIVDFNPDRIYSSPLIRCQETIKGAFPAWQEKLVLDERIIEMDYGKWSGKELKKLAKEPLWKKISSAPIDVTFPLGESFSAAQERIDNFLDEISSTGQTAKKIVVVSHGDIIRIAINQLLGRDFNNFQNLRITPASRSLFYFYSNKGARQLPVIDYINREVEVLKKRKNSKFQLGGEV
jgi:broad specificity phosphatase PhoE